MNGKNSPKSSGGGARGSGSGPSGHGQGHGRGKHGGKRPVKHEHPRGEARLDRERAVAELKRFLDLALREMGLAVESEITTAPAHGASRASTVAAADAAVAPEADPDAQPTEEQFGAQPMDLERQPGNTIEQPEEPEISILFRGEDADLLLERNAELLLALEHVAHRWLRLDPRLHDQVRFDCGDYRTMRLDELKLSARVAAQRVRETGQPFRFNPMSPRERRLIHLELTGAQGVRTASEGIGDRRQLVIYPTTKGKPLPQR
jgi:predicted RNA-binding protein Jag